jgi:hypothetical protein
MNYNYSNPYFVGTTIFKSDKVIFIGKGGYDSDRERAEKYKLVVGNTYTIDTCHIDSFSSNITLVEVPDLFHNNTRVNFNTCLFKDIDETESDAEYIERVKPTLEQLMIYRHDKKNEDYI